MAGAMGRTTTATRSDSEGAHSSAQTVKMAAMHRRCGCAHRASPVTTTRRSNCRQKSASWT
eukprot:1903387-Prymnesium_polylepis.3